MATLLTMEESLILNETMYRFKEGDMVRIKRNCSGTLKGDIVRLEMYCGELNAVKDSARGDCCSCQDNWKLITRNSDQNGNIINKGKIFNFK